MRIALTIHSFCQGGGGMERSASELANGLVSLGYDVVILSIGGGNHEPPYVLDERVGITWLELNRSARNKVEALFEISRTVLGLRKAIIGFEADVVIAFGNQTAISSLVGCYGTRAKVIVAERTHPAFYHIGRGWEPLRRLIYPKAAVLVAQTHDIRRWYVEELNCRRVEVVPNIVTPCGGAEHPHSDRSRQVVALGRLDSIKGFDVLIEVFAQLADAFPDWNLTVFGEGPERGRLEYLIQEHGLKERVSLPGWVDSAHEALAGKDLFVLTSQTEGFPNALCEAMACGVPAVAFDCRSGPADIIRHQVDGLLVPLGDRGKLREGMMRLMRDEELRRQYAAEAVQVVNRFSRGNVISLWDKIIREVVVG